jgi:hypothetical protein
MGRASKRMRSFIRRILFLTMASPLCAILYLVLRRSLYSQSIPPDFRAIVRAIEAPGVFTRKEL